MGRRGPTRKWNGVGDVDNDGCHPAFSTARNATATSALCGHQLSDFTVFLAISFSAGTALATRFEKRIQACLRDAMRLSRRREDCKYGPILRRRHLLNPLRVPCAVAAVLTVDTAQSTATMCIIGRWINLAMPRPEVGRNTSRTQMVSCLNRRSCPTLKVSMTSTCRVARRAGALVDLPDFDRIEVNIEPNRDRDAHEFGISEYSTVGLTKECSQPGSGADVTLSVVYIKFRMMMTTRRSRYRAAGGIRTGLPPAGEREHCGTRDRGTME